MPDPATKFVADVVAALRKRKYADYIKQSPSEIADTVASEARVVIGAQLRKKPKPKPGASKVGGKPDLPKGTKWPTAKDSDEPLAFLAQINLADVEPHDLAGKLPARGMLWFFTIADGNRAYGGELDSSTSAIVYAATPKNLGSRDIPEELADNDDARIDERVLEFGPSLAIESCFDASIEEAIDKTVARLGGKSGAVKMLDPEGEHIVLVSFDGYVIAEPAYGEGYVRWVLAPQALKKGKLQTAELDYSGGT